MYSPTVAGGRVVEVTDTDVHNTTDGGSEEEKTRTCKKETKKGKGRKGKLEERDDS